MRGYAEGKRTNNTEMMRMMEAVSPTNGTRSHVTCPAYDRQPVSVLRQTPLNPPAISVAAKLNSG